MIPKLKLRFTLVILILGTIALLPLMAHAQTPISCGQILSGSISAAGEKDSFSLTALGNDGVTIRVRKTSEGFAPYLELYDPTGNFIMTGSQINATLTSSGTYKVMVRDYNNVNTGSYLLYWERMNNPCSVVASLGCDQVVSGSIGTGANPPPWRLYTFTASANDAVTIRARKTSEETFIPLLELYGPSGDFIASGYNYPLDVVLAASGTYKILIA